MHVNIQPTIPKELAIRKKPTTPKDTSTEGAVGAVPRGTGPEDTADTIAKDTSPEKTVDIECTTLKDTSSDKTDESFVKRWFKKLDRKIDERWTKRLGWSIVTLFMPEVTFAIALYESRSASILREKMKSIYQGHVDKPEAGNAGAPTANNTVTAQYSLDAWENKSLSYFVLMGGFRIVRGETVNPHLLPGSCPGRVGPIERALERMGWTWVKSTQEAPQQKYPLCRTLTPWGVYRMAEKKLLPHVPAENIKDKSNANTLAKVIVISQALWMMLQVLGRLLARQEVTLLEAHTALHVVCAAAMHITVSLRQ